MPKAKDAAEQWLQTLKDQGKLSDENLEAIKTALTPESVEFIGSSVLRQDDYSRLANAAKAKEKEVETFQASLAEWKSDAEKEYFAMQARERVAQAEVARLKSLAISYDVPESELGKVQTVTDPTAATPPAAQIDTSKFMDRQEAQEALMNALKVQNKLMSLAAKHQGLFNKPLDDEAIVDRAIASGRTIEQEWEESYKVADRRAEIAGLQQEAHDQKIREEERAKLLSELKLPETRTGVPTSPVLHDLMKPVESRTETQSGIQAALEAYGAGKYRQQTS